MALKLPEICERADKIAPGHRACLGCGETIVVRQVLHAIDEPLVVGTPTGCLEIVTSPFPLTSWRIPWVHNLFENAATTIAGAEAAYKALVRKGKLEDRGIKFLVFAGDGATYDIGLQWLSGVLERGHRIFYVCLNNEAYMNCLSTSSLIVTKNGLKGIAEVKEGDQVYAFDQKNNRIVSKRCTGVFNNGEREILEVNTAHHAIRATPNHPFLVLKRNGRGRKNELVWKTLSELRVGDEVVVLKRLDGQKSFEFNFNPIEKEGKVTRLKELRLPKRSSPTLMRYLGIWVGDGWVRTERGEVGFALPRGSKERGILIKHHLALFGNGVRDHDGMYVYVNSVNLAKFIDSLGFGSGARNKTIPAWIFTLPRKEKEAFVEGLVLSDGYKIGNSFRFISASHELLRRLRLLLQTMEYRVGKIHTQEKKGSECVKRRLSKKSTYGCICFSKRRKWNVKKYPSQYKYQDFLVGNKNFEMEKIKEIKAVGREPTLDLRVEGEHNFIADGIVVHNTGIQRSGATPLGAWTTTTPVGKVLPGKVQHRKDLTFIIHAHNIPYVAQGAPHAWRDLMRKVKKAIAVNGPSFINVLAPCPRGWRYDPEETIAISRLSTETCTWPLFEVENGTWKLNFKPAKKKPITDWLKSQGRFAHLLRAENKWVIEELQARTDRDWNGLLKRCEP